MKSIKLLCLLWLAIVPIFATTPEALYDKINSSYNALSTWQASLSQTNQYAQIDRSTTFTGKIYFQPGRLAIRFEKPYKQYMTVDRGIVTLFDSQSNTAIKSRIQPDFDKLNPVEILRYYWKLSTVRITSEKDGQISVTLTPKKDKLIASLSATINLKSGFVQQLSYIDISKNSVKYEFSNIKANSPIPASVWQLDIPKNAQIIEQ
ncbi:MAG: outer membrane lipoprotein carrier protein LolA [Candidatus Cloacimonetes bacterium HGW-Cloacimonetes-1]|jgi:outer membrane lipoprotein carrier protein|nr:MAG: outer membrane lipoprotein carrier protein LolA [Candidatus Cloacimonetes bacterium HGW-Cloacimonetes-1]